MHCKVPFGLNHRNHANEYSNLLKIDELHCENGGQKVAVTTIHTQIVYPPCSNYYTVPLEYNVIEHWLLGVFSWGSCGVETAQVLMHCAGAVTA